MGKRFVALVAVLALPLLPAPPVGAGDGRDQGSFVARALPFPMMEADIYYPQKASCLAGVDGIHKVSEPFEAPAPGALSVHLEGLSGDWDVYVVGTGGKQLGVSDNAQILEGADGEERLTVSVNRHQRVQMVACNWLGEPEVTVNFDFVTKKNGATKLRRNNSASARGKKRTTHRVDAVGGPVTPLWEWDPSELEISVGDKVEWRNETGSDHHVTSYGGPWEDVDTMHLPVDGKVGFVFRRPGEYLYRCDFAFAGVEHSLLVGDECIGMCGRIVVKKRR
ncbi:MAG: cupredoxin domain-containing protein [Actinomycetota bacterium]